MAKQEDIRGLLTQQFEGFEAEPDVDLWPEIEAKLHPGKKNKVLWLTALTIAASIAMLFVVIKLLNNPVEPQKSIALDQAPMISPDNNSEDQTEELFAEAQIEENKSNELSEAVNQADSDHKREEKALRPVRTELNQSVGEPEPKNKGETGVEILPKQTTIIENLVSNQEKPPIQEIQKTVLPKEDILVDSENVPLAETTPLIASSDQRGSNNKLDLRDFSFKNLVSFTTNELSKIERSPIDVYRQEGEDGETKIVQFDLFNLSFSHKSHKRRAKKL